MCRTKVLFVAYSTNFANNLNMRSYAKINDLNLLKHCSVQISPDKGSLIRFCYLESKILLTLTMDWIVYQKEFIFEKKQ